MRKIEIVLCDCLSQYAGGLCSSHEHRLEELAYISTHMVVSPTLETSTRLVRISTVDFDQLVQHTAGEVEVLIPHVLAEDEKYLCYIVRDTLPGTARCKAPSFCWRPELTSGTPSW